MYHEMVKYRLNFFFKLRVQSWVAAHPSGNPPKENERIYRKRTGDESKREPPRAHRGLLRGILEKRGGKYTRGLHVPRSRVGLEMPGTRIYPLGGGRTPPIPFTLSPQFFSCTASFHPNSRSSTSSLSAAAVHVEICTDKTSLQLIERIGGGGGEVSAFSFP